jgi:hypothetical protein
MQLLIAFELAGQNTPPDTSLADPAREAKLNCPISMAAATASASLSTRVVHV